MINKHKPGKNPNSLKNLRRSAGPGRPKISPEERERKKVIREFMREYLENGEAVKDFQRVRAKKPDVALGMAMDRIYGPAGRSDQEKTRYNVNLLVAALTGKWIPTDQVEEGPSMIIEDKPFIRSE